MHIIGSETEYGIVAPQQPDISPILTSTQAVIAYAHASAQGIHRRTRWDYELESPLRDIRGFDLRRYRPGSAPTLDPNALGAANVITSAGARLYVDHAHPEYSSPETSSAWDALTWDKAGDSVMHTAAEASGRTPGQPQLKIYKNNVDGKGASYGAHENYLFPRDIDMERLQQALIPHFITRQIYTGAGRVGLGPAGEHPGFQISQRADYIETLVSLETTVNRGIINTRDEPHANPQRWRRLHVIIGDANMAETSGYLKFGTTALVLRAVELGADFSDLQFIEPVDAVRQVSRDLQCTAILELYGGKRATAIQIQRELRDRVVDALSNAPAPAHDGTAWHSVQDDDHTVLREWGQILDALEDDPLSTAGHLDWTAKLALIQGYQSRGVHWSDPRLALIDLQYSDIDPHRGLYYALCRRGRMRTLLQPSDISHAAQNPPTTTRAWLRGYLVSHYAEKIYSANWDSIILDHPYQGNPATHIRLEEPLQMTRTEILGEAESPLALSDLVARIGAQHRGAISGTGKVVLKGSYQSE